MWKIRRSLKNQIRRECKPLGPIFDADVNISDEAINRVFQATYLSVSRVDVAAALIIEELERSVYRESGR